MKFGKAVTAMVLAIMVFGMLKPTAWAQKGAGKIDDATKVVDEIMSIPEKGIPPALLRDAHGIIIFPGLVKVGFVVGGRYGTGVMLARDSYGTWGNPVFVNLYGGSVGWQIGAQATDVILVLKSSKSIDGILKGKFTLGADASVAAGPVGRTAEAATDVTFRSEILSYSRSRGLFAGVSLEGAALRVDQDADASFYGKKLDPRDILMGKGAKTPEIATLQQTLAKYSTVKQ